MRSARKRTAWLKQSPATEGAVVAREGGRAERKWAFVPSERRFRRRRGRGARVGGGAQARCGAGRWARGPCWSSRFTRVVHMVWRCAPQAERPSGRAPKRPSAHVQCGAVRCGNEQRLQRGAAGTQPPVALLQPGQPPAACQRLLGCRRCPSADWRPACLCAAPAAHGPRHHTGAHILHPRGTLPPHSASPRFGRKRRKCPRLPLSLISRQLSASSRPRTDQFRRPAPLRAPLALSVQCQRFVRLPST